MSLDKKDLFDVLPKFADEIKMTAATQAALKKRKDLGISTASLGLGSSFFPFALLGNALTILLLTRESRVLK